jgi:Family of unknown function (DUF5996)
MYLAGVSARAVEPAETWPPLPLEAWQPTYATLHMYSQVIGKIRLGLAPLVNHWWNVTLYVSPRGLTTSAIPYGGGSFDITFDFLAHEVVIETSRGERRTLPLRPRAVADFFADVTGTMRDLGIAVRMWRMPVEIPDPIPFDEDRRHASYDPDAARRFWRILLSVERVFQEFRSRFIGKCSPVHFFWGSFDLAVTRFSGRRAPPREGADAMTREAYSHEVISGGFWPGGGAVAGPAFYAYAAPEPPGFEARPVRPSKAFYHPELKEFLLMYDDLRQEASPGAALMAFLQSTYEAGAELGAWDRPALERAL